MAWLWQCFHAPMGEDGRCCASPAQAPACAHRSQYRENMTDDCPRSPTTSRSAHTCSRGGCPRSMSPRAQPKSARARVGLDGPHRPPEQTPQCAPAFALDTPSLLCRRKTIKRLTRSGRAFYAKPEVVVWAIALLMRLVNAAWVRRQGRWPLRERFAAKGREALSAIRQLPLPV